MPSGPATSNYRLQLNNTNVVSLEIIITGEKVLFGSIMVHTDSGHNSTDTSQNKSMCEKNYRAENILKNPNSQISFEQLIFIIHPGNGFKKIIKYKFFKRFYNHRADR